MDGDKIWETEKWTSQAKNILKGLSEFPHNSKIVYILRHSHRDSIDNIYDISKLRLTEKGHETAKKFGSLLPSDKSIRLHYSVVERCKETAEDILTGYSQVSEKGTIRGSMDELWNIGMEPDYFFNEMTKYPYARFLYRWVSGLYPPSVTTHFSEFCKNAAKKIWGNLASAPDNNIDIYVTHDLVVLTFRLGWFGLLSTGYWPSFLGGFAFTLNSKEILLLDYDKFKSIEIPFWWNEK